MELDIKFGQIVHYGYTQGFITEIEKTPSGGVNVTVHLEDGRYRKNVSILAILKNKLWSVTSDIADISDVKSAVSKADDYQCMYSYKLAGSGGFVIGESLGSSSLSVQVELYRKGLFAKDIKKNSDQITKPLVRIAYR